MTNKQAKDFLAQQAAEQAARENVPLSEIERKMMYFTESDPASCPNPLEINNEFEAEYETTEYESKMSKLLHHAYKRLKEENPEGNRNWDEAIRTLRKGDHYLLVLWDQPTGERPPYDSLKLFGTALLVIAVLLAFFWVADKYHIDRVSRRYIWDVLAALLVVSWRPARRLYALLIDRFHRRTNGRA